MYQIVTDRIISALEQGVKPLACPWDKTQQCDMLPMNFKTKAQYTGINILLLWPETVEKGYSSPYWLTYKQAAELGGNVERNNHHLLQVVGKRKRGRNRRKNPNAEIIFRLQP